MTYSDNILMHLERGTLLRYSWGDGYEKACLLAAVFPEVAQQRRTEACPAGVIPRWFADFTITIDDNSSDAAWEPAVRRYAALSLGWHLLNADAWERVLHACLIEILRMGAERIPAPALDEAMQHAIAWLEAEAPFPGPVPLGYAEGDPIRLRGWTPPAAVRLLEEVHADTYPYSVYATISRGRLSGGGQKSDVLSASIHLSSLVHRAAAAHVILSGWRAGTAKYIDRVIAAALDAIESQIALSQKEASL